MKLPVTGSQTSSRRGVQLNRDLTDSSRLLPYKTTGQLAVLVVNNALFSGPDPKRQSVRLINESADVLAPDKALRELEKI